MLFPYNSLTVPCFFGAFCSMQLKVENRFQRSSDYLYLINKLVVQNENFQEAKQNDYGKPTELLNLLIFLSRWENKSESMDRGN